MYTRRKLVQDAGKAFVLTSAVGIAPHYLGSTARAAGLSSGMTGGPTGFDGCERYQYNPDMSEGRAIEGIKALKAAGKAPKKLVMMVIDGVAGQFTKPFPTPESPSAKQIWEKETGVEIELIPVSIFNTYQPTMRDRATNAGEFDIYNIRWNSFGDYVAANVLFDCTEFYDKYRPDFSDPTRGYIGGKRTETYLNRMNGKYYLVNIDGDFQGWYYRKDLWEDPKEQAAFRARYGYNLAAPRTYKELDQMAEFFHRPDKGLVGYTDWRNQNWGWVMWYMRYVSRAVPNQYLFDNKGTPLIFGEQGVAATKEYLESMRWRNTDAINWTYAEQYGNWAKAGAALTAAVPNLPKFTDVPGNPVYGKTAIDVTPGHIHGDSLIRRSVINFQCALGVSQQSKYPEAAWLFLQWFGSSRIYSWMCGNPAGYADPVSLPQFDDPLVVKTYHKYNLDAVRKNIERAVPSLNIEGEQSLHNALDEQLLACITKRVTPEQAMENAAKNWTRIIRRKGDKIIDRINSYQATWSTIVDKA